MSSGSVLSFHGVVAFKGIVTFGNDLLVRNILNFICFYAFKLGSGSGEEGRGGPEALLLKLCGSRKKPYPHHGGNWKFRRDGGGGGGQKPRKIQRRGGLNG